MNPSLQPLPPVKAIAGEVFAAQRAATQITPFSARYEGFDLATARAVSLDVRGLRGETVIGRKIGFTNRTLWERYGVDGPMWGDMTNATVSRLGASPVSVGHYCEPRLEPEVALKLKSIPTAEMSEAALIECIEWFAPAFEIVHSIFPGWQFTLADCAAANALHAQLLLGPPCEPGPWALKLPQLVLSLTKDGAVVEKGAGENVLGGPLSALRYLIESLTKAGEDGLRPGDLITTGTLTDAWPVAPGARFGATYEGSPLNAIAAHFTN